MTLIRTAPSGSATDLAKRLATDSKLEELRGVLVRQFLERSKLLRARSALAVVRAVLRRGGCADAELIDARVEEVMGAAHEFVEVRLLTDLRTGTVGIAERLEEEMDRLLGGSGHSSSRAGWGCPRTPRFRSCSTPRTRRWTGGGGWSRHR